MQLSKVLNAGINPKAIDLQTMITKNVRWAKFISVPLCKKHYLTLCGNSYYSQNKKKSMLHSRNSRWHKDQSCTMASKISATVGGNECLVARPMNSIFPTAATQTRVV